MYFLPVSPTQKFNHATTSFPVAAFSLLGRRQEGKGRENREKEIQEVQEPNRNSVKASTKEKIGIHQ